MWLFHLNNFFLALTIQQIVCKEKTSPNWTWQDDRLPERSRRNILLWPAYDVSGCYLFNNCYEGHSSNYPCSCDTLSCNVYKDCCRDAFGPGDIIPKHYLSDYTTCHNINSREHIYVIAQCPADTPNDIRVKCETVKTVSADLKDAPVYSRASHLTYLNSYCAECYNDHGSHLVYFNLLVYNPFMSFDECDLLSGQNISSECIIEYSIPKEADQVRRCLPSFLNNCSAKWIKEHGESYITVMCENGGFAPLSSMNFRNMFCLLCNGYNNTLTHCLWTDDLFSHGMFSKSLRLLLDLTSVQVMMPENKDLQQLKCVNMNYVHFEGVCYEIQCRFGYTYSSKDNNCKKNILKIENVMLNYSLYLTVGKISDTAKSLLDKQHFSNFEDVMHDLNIGVSMPFAQGLYLPGQESNTLNDCFLVQFMYKLYIDWPFTINLENILFNLAKSQWFLQFPTIDNNNEITRATRKTMQEACSYCKVNHSISNLCNKNIQFEEILSSNLDILKTSLHNNLDCPFITFPLKKSKRLLNDFSYEINKTLFYNKNDNISLCIDTFEKFRHARLNANPSLFVFGATEIIITYVTFGISSLSLMIFILLHLTDDRFKTSGGKNILTLAAFLLFAQTIFVVGDGASGWPITCQIIGVLLHFSWTCVFFWITISAYVLWKHFRLNVLKIPNDKNFYIRNVTVCFVLSFCIVCPMACLHFFENANLNIKYGGPVCFLSSGSGLIFGIYVPLGIMFIMSGAFVINFLLIIKKHKSSTSHLATKHRSYFFILLRVASMFGFSWLIGMIAALLNNETLWVIFYLFTGLHGFFLALAFTSREKLENICQWITNHLNIFKKRRTQ